MTFVVALTGGIGSGKSTASSCFEALNVPVIDADVIAHALCAPNQPALQEIAKTFGDPILNADGSLDRSQLRKLVFQDETARKKLEKILHPLIYDEIINKIKKVTAPYCLLVIPLLAENFEKYQPLIDHVIVLETPQHHQIQWAAERDKDDIEAIERIATQQASHAARLKIADTLLKNDSTIQSLKIQVERLHQQFLRLQ